MDRGIRGHDVARWTWSRWATVLGAGVAVTALCQLVYHLTGTGGRILSLDREISLHQGNFPIPAAISGLVLVLAGVAWWRLGGVARRVLGAFLLFMSLDELVGIHEEVGHLLHMKWLEAYLPVVAFGGIAALVVVWQCRHPVLRRSATLLVLGGVCWAVAQVLELLEWHGEHKAAHYLPMMTTEEILETTGSSLFALAALWLRERRRHGVPLADEPLPRVVTAQGTAARHHGGHHQGHLSA